MMLHCDSVGMAAAFIVTTVDVELLFARFGSVSVAETVAVSVRVPGAPGVLITSVTVALAPLANPPIEHVTFVVPLHAPWLEAVETSDVPVGKASVMTTFVAL